MFSDDQLRALLALEEGPSGQVKAGHLIRAEIEAYERQVKSWRTAGRGAVDDDEADWEAAVSGTGSPNKKTKEQKNVGKGRKRRTAPSAHQDGKENVPLGASKAPIRIGGGVGSARQRVPGGRQENEPFTFSSLIRHVVLPEDRASGEDGVADALLAATHIHLASVGLTDSSILECLGGATHCYLQHNNLTHVDGLEMMLRLTVAVFHHNHVKTLQPLASLPSLTFLDASYNDITELDPSAHLPTETLRSLNLTGNPCAPDYDMINTKAAAEEQVEYLGAYRAEITAACPHLTNLDGVAVQASEADVGSHLLQSMADDATDQKCTEGNNAMTTNFRDEDFFDGPGGNEGDDDDDTEATRTPVTAGAGLPKDDAANGSSGDDDRGSGVVAAERKRKKSNAERGSPDNHRSTGSSAPSTHVHSITSSLLVRYEHERQAKSDAMAEAVGASDIPLHSDHLVVPIDDDDDDEDDDDDSTDIASAHKPATRSSESEFAGTEGFRRASANQSALRTELRFAQNHHSQVAMMMVANTWNEVEQRLQKRQEDSMDRRARLAAIMARPSAAYLAALEILEKESGGKGLDHYRKLPPSEQTPGTLPPAATSSGNSDAVPQL